MRSDATYTILQEDFLFCYFLIVVKKTLNMALLLALKGTLPQNSQKGKICHINSFNIGGLN